MDNFAQQTVHLFSTHQAELSDRIVMRFFRTRQGGVHLYDFGGFSGCMRDVNTHLFALADSMAANDPALFVDYATAACSALVSRKVPVEHLVDVFGLISRILPEVLPEDIAGQAANFVAAGVRAMGETSERPVYVTDEGSLARLTRQYLDDLLTADYESAEALIHCALSEGVGVEDVYLDVLQPAQRELGRLWELNQISVAKEHYCTACTRSIMAQLCPASANGGQNGRSVVAVCVIGELHDLGLTMVCDFLRRRGWSAHLVGANLPPEDIVASLVEHNSKLLAVSATMVYHLRWVHAVVELVRSSEQCREVRILVGGSPFLISGDLWRKLGADACAPDSREAADLAEHLMAAQVGS